MRRTPWIQTLVLLALVATTAAAGSKSAKPAAQDGPHHKASKGEWPDTPTAALARRWAESFSKGEKVMSAALPEILSPESLAKRSMEERMESYRKLHDRLGNLMLVKIESATADSLVATMASSDMSQLQLVFSFVKAESPKLTSVAIREYQSHGHGDFHH